MLKKRNKIKKKNKRKRRMRNMALKMIKKMKRNNGKEIESNSLMKMDSYMRLKRRDLIKMMMNISIIEEEEVVEEGKEEEGEEAEVEEEEVVVVVEVGMSNKKRGSMEDFIEEGERKDKILKNL